MAKRDYYEVLGVDRNVDEDAIKKAYRRLAMKFHPDRAGDSAEAQDRFKEVKEAYEVLSDARKRQVYDQHGHAAFEQGGGARGHGGPGGVDLGDIFGDLFGDIFGGGGRSRGPRRGADLRMEIEIDLEEAVNGLTREIRVPSLVNCVPCKGSGSKDGKTKRCTTCAGVGRVRIQQGIFSVQQACPSCHGSGQMIENPCTACHGRGKVEEVKTLSVKIPAGVDTGDRIRLTNEGAAGDPGAPPGDLYIDVSVRPHPVFEREGDNLYLEMPIRFSTAALGGRLNIPTLNGEEAELELAEGTQTGEVFHLRGRGVRSVRSHRAGDLVCRVVVETPVRLTREQRELLEQFEASFEGENAARHSPKTSSWLDGVKSFIDRMTS